MHKEQMRVEGLNGISVVELKGDFDAGSVREMEALFDSLIRMRKKLVIVDMTEAGFIGNSVISLLLGSVGRMRKSGIELKMCGVPDLVSHVFTILGVEEHLSIFEDRIGAILSSPEKHRRRVSIQDRRAGTDRRKSDLSFQGEDRRRGERRRAASQGPGSGLPALVFA